MNIEEAVKELRGYLTWVEANGFSKLAKDSAIETLLTAYEKEKRLAEANLKDSEEFKDNMCNHRCILNSKVMELEEELEKEKEKNKEIEELKEDNKHQWEERCKLTFELENSTSNDKIKAKIEELEKQDKESKLSHNYLVIPVLQSLLEKE